MYSILTEAFSSSIYGQICVYSLMTCLLEFVYLLVHVAVVGCCCCCWVYSVLVCIKSTDGIFSSLMWPLKLEQGQR